MDGVKSLLLKLGIRSTLRGFRFLWYALNLCLSNEDYLLNVFSVLCEEVARHYGTNKDNVEHCIRTAVANCWFHGNREFLIKIAGYELKHKPSNGEFIDILYNYLKSLEG